MRATHTLMLGGSSASNLTCWKGWTNLLLLACHACQKAAERTAGRNSERASEATSVAGTCLFYIICLERLIFMSRLRIPASLQGQVNEQRATRKARSTTRQKDVPMTEAFSPKLGDNYCFYSKRPRWCMRSVRNQTLVVCCGSMGSTTFSWHLGICSEMLSSIVSWS